MITYRKVELQKTEQSKGKAKYIIDDRACFAEEAAIANYENLGFNALWTENSFWWTMMALLFWDVIFAKVRGAVGVMSGGVQEELDVDDQRFDKLFAFTIQTNGMPIDFFTSDFYSRRQGLIRNRIQELLHSDGEQKLRESYKNNYGNRCRIIEHWSKVNIDNLIIPIKRLGIEKVLNIVERLISNFNENRAGLPDLIVYNDNDFFFSEVKTEKDKISEKQSDWQSYLSESLGIKVEIFLINKSEAEAKQIEKTKSSNAYEVIVSFGNSSSSKKEDAIKFIKEQTSYFTKGEGKEQIHGAKFNTSEIDKLYTILDLTSGWKTQKIEINGEIVRSADLRSALWCYREKNKLHASSDYCKRREYDNKVNKFGCKNIYFNELLNDQWREYGYIDTAKGEWIFDRKAIESKIKEEINRLKYCPLFDIEKLESWLKKLPEKINPKSDLDYAFISNNYENWFWHDNRWMSIFGKTEFPGFSVMVGVQKISKKEINDALRYSKLDSPITITYKAPSRGRGKSSGCFIATAVYGDYNAVEVKTLRLFRDNFLKKHFLGNSFIKIYYLISPPIADYLEKHSYLKRIVKIFLDFMIAKVRV